MAQPTQTTNPASAPRWKMGPTVRACYLRPGLALLVAEDTRGWWRPATRLRDAVAVEVVTVTGQRPGRQLMYAVTGRRLDNDQVVELAPLFGQNAVPTAVAR